MIGNHKNIDRGEREVNLAGKTKKRVKHVPQRTCVGCRTVLPKRELIRLVRTPDGVMVDPTGKLAGRGVYLHNRRSCWERGLAGAVARGLKVDLTDLDRERMRAFQATLLAEPEDIPAEQDQTDEVSGLNRMNA